MFIFLRAALLIMFATSNVYMIANDRYVIAICLGVGISTMWTLNIRDLAISCWKDRISYIAGGVVGMSASLFVLDKIFQ